MLRSIFDGEILNATSAYIFLNISVISLWCLTCLATAWFAFTSTSASSFDAHLEGSAASISLTNRSTILSPLDLTSDTPALSPALVLEVALSPLMAAPWSDRNPTAHADWRGCREGVQRRVERLDNAYIVSGTQPTNASNTDTSNTDTNTSSSGDV